MRSLAFAFLVLILILIMNASLPGAGLESMVDGAHGSDQASAGAVPVVEHVHAQQKARPTQLASMPLASSAALGGVAFASLPHGSSPAFGEVDLASLRALVPVKSSTKGDGP